MQLVKILENEFVSMWHYPDRGIVHHQFHQHIFDEPFRETLNAGAEVFAQSGANKWLSDDRENCALSNEDSDWAMSVWFPRVQACCWSHWAIVLPEHVLGQMNMKRFIATYRDKGITAQVFHNPELALAWLTDPSKELVRARTG